MRPSLRGQPQPEGPGPAIPGCRTAPTRTGLGGAVALGPRPPHAPHGWGCPRAAPPENPALPELLPVPCRVSPYLHKEAAVLDAEAPGSGREAVDDHVGIILVGVVDGQQTRAGGAHTQVAETEEGRPGKVAQNQHGGVLIRVLLTAPQGPAPPAGVAVPPRRCGARGHGRTGAERRLRTGSAAPTAARAFKSRAPPIAARTARDSPAPSLLSQSQRGSRPFQSTPPLPSANHRPGLHLNGPARGAASAAREGSVDRNGNTKQRRGAAVRDSAPPAMRNAPKPRKTGWGGVCK